MTRKPEATGMNIRDVKLVEVTGHNEPGWCSSAERQQFLLAHLLRPERGAISLPDQPRLRMELNEQRVEATRDWPGASDTRVASWPGTAFSKRRHCPVRCTADGAVRRGRVLRGGDAAWNRRFATTTFRFLNPPHVRDWVKAGFRVVIHD